MCVSGAEVRNYLQEEVRGVQQGVLRPDQAHGQGAQSQIRARLQLPAVQYQVSDWCITTVLIVILRVQEVVNHFIMKLTI